MVVQPPVSIVTINWKQFLVGILHKFIQLIRKLLPILRTSVTCSNQGFSKLVIATNQYGFFWGKRMVNETGSKVAHQRLVGWFEKTCSTVFHWHGSQLVSNSVSSITTCSCGSIACTPGDPKCQMSLGTFTYPFIGWLVLTYTDIWCSNRSGKWKNPSVQMLSPFRCQKHHNVSLLRRWHGCWSMNAQRNWSSQGVGHELHGGVRFPQW